MVRSIGDGPSMVALASVLALVAVSTLPGVAVAQQKPPGAPTAAQPTASFETLSMGQTVRGFLSTDDMRLDDGSYAQVFNFNGQAGQRIIVRMESTALDPMLLMLGPNNFSQTNDDADASTLNAVLDVTLPATGTYTIAANTAVAGQTGAFNLSVTGQTPPAQARNRPAPPPPAARQQAVWPIQVDQSIESVLTTSDLQLDDGSYAQVWAFTGRAGQRLNVSMGSSAFQPLLMLLGPNNFSQSNADRLNSGFQGGGISVVLPVSGEYRIVASTSRPSQTGEYRLQLSPPDQGFRWEPDPPSAAPPRSARARQLIAASNANASERPTRAECRAVAEAQISLKSEQLLTGNTSGAPDQYFRYTGQKEAAERLLAILSSATGPVRDQFRRLTPDPLTVTVARCLGQFDTATTPPAPPPAAPPPPARPPAARAGSSPPQAARPARQASGGAIAVGDTVNGSLTSSDPTLSDGTHVHQYQFNGQAGQQISITLDSSAFDPVLLVVGPNNFQQINDDGPGMGLNSRLDLTLPTTGTYTISPNTVARGATGAYRLAVTGAGSATASRTSPTPPPARQQAASPPPAPAQNASFNAARECPPMPAGANPNIQGRRLASGGPIRFDDPVCGRLQQGDQTLNDGTFVDIYTIDLQPSGQYGYQAILQAEGFEPNILVLPPNGNASALEVMPVSSGSSFNMAITARAAGSYTIAVNAMTAGAGRYRMRVVRTAD